MLKANTVHARHADVCTYLQGNLDWEDLRVPHPCRHRSRQPRLRDGTAWRPPGSAALFSSSSVTSRPACATRRVRVLLLGIVRADGHGGAAQALRSQARTRLASAMPPPWCIRPATLRSGVLLGPYCVIGANTSIGDGCCVGAHVVVENDVAPYRRGNHAASARVRRCRQRDGLDCEIHAHQHRQRRVRLCGRRRPGGRRRSRTSATWSSATRWRSAATVRSTARSWHRPISAPARSSTTSATLPTTATWARTASTRLLRLDRRVDHHRSPLHDRRQLSGLGAPHAGRRCRAGGPVDGDRRRDGGRGAMVIR